MAAVPVAGADHHAGRHRRRDHPYRPHRHRAVGGTKGAETAATRSAETATEGAAAGTKGADGTTPAVSGPKEPYNRRQHYGSTPTAADRRAVGAGPGQVADHDPQLVKRYYEGDPAHGERPGYMMTEAERKASAGDRSRMTPQDRGSSDQQGW